MKTTVLLIAALIFLMCFTCGSSYFNISATEEQRSVFANIGGQSNASIVLKALPSGETQEKKQEVELKLMTYNIHRGISKNGKLDLSATADVIKSSDAAIIALQEVERYSIRSGFSDQIKVLSDQMKMNYAFGKSLNILNGEYGNGLLSKYPIEEYKVYDLPSYSEQRTLMRSVVNVAGTRLAVYNTHLGLKEAERKEQLDFILAMTGEETLNYVLMGDMNTKVNRLQKVLDSMKDSSQTGPEQSQSTFEENEVKERIDYIFVSPEIKIKGYKVIVSEASDHYPAVSDIVVNK